jgi:hypothetical protein
MGIRFYSLFSDNTLLISHSYHNPLFPDPNSRIIKNSSCQTAEEAWSLHKSRTAELEAQGVTIHNLGSFAQYVELAKRVTAGMMAQA